MMPFRHEQLDWFDHRESSHREGTGTMVRQLLAQQSRTRSFRQI